MFFELCNRYVCFSVIFKVLRLFFFVKFLIVWLICIYVFFNKSNKFEFNCVVKVKGMVGDDWWSIIKMVLCNGLMICYWYYIN